MPTTRTTVNAKPIRLGHPAAKRLAALYTRAGLPVEVEAGPVGLVVYGSDAATVRRVAQSLASTPRVLGGEVTVGPITVDQDEPEATRFWTTVEFDWSVIEDRGPAMRDALRGKAVA